MKEPNTTTHFTTVHMASLPFWESLSLASTSVKDLRYDVGGSSGLNLIPALRAPGKAVWLPEGEAPRDQADTGSRIPERHRRAGLRFHRVGSGSSLSETPSSGNLGSGGSDNLPL